MTEKEKPDLTRTEVGRMIDAEVREEIAKLQRPSRAMQAVNATLDVTEKYPVAAWILGTVGFAASLVFLDGQKMWIGVVASACLPPGWAKKIVKTVAGLKKAKAGE
jgi:hypothetical protein